MKVFDAKDNKLGKNFGHTMDFRFVSSVRCSANGGGKLHFHN